MGESGSDYDIQNLLKYKCIEDTAITYVNTTQGKQNNLMFGFVIDDHTKENIEDNSLSLSEIQAIENLELQNYRLLKLVNTTQNIIDVQHNKIHNRLINISKQLPKTNTSTYEHLKECLKSINAYFDNIFFIICQRCEQINARLQSSSALFNKDYQRKVNEIALFSSKIQKHIRYFNELLKKLVSVNMTKVKEAYEKQEIKEIERKENAGREIERKEQQRKILKQEEFKKKELEELKRKELEEQEKTRQLEMEHKENVLNEEFKRYKETMSKIPTSNIAQYFYDPCMNYSMFLKHWFCGCDESNSIPLFQICSNDADWVIYNSSLQYKKYFPVACLLKYCFGNEIIKVIPTIDEVMKRVEKMALHEDAMYARQPGFLVEYLSNLQTRLERRNLMITLICIAYYTIQD